MKKIITTFIVFLFVGTAVFGIIFMNYVMMRHTDCVASTMTGNPCPTNEIQLFIHHISSVQILSIAVVPPIFIILSLIVSLLFFTYFSYFKKHIYFHTFSSLFRQHKKKILDYYNIILLSWLSLFEHSPSILK